MRKSKNLFFNAEMRGRIEKDSVPENGVCNNENSGQCLLGENCEYNEETGRKIEGEPIK